MKKRYAPYLCLPLACVFALTACTPGGGAGDANADALPIEVPPPVEQTNEGLTIFYTDAIPLQATILDMAVGQYNREHPDNPVTAEKVFTDSSNTVRDEETQQMLAQVMAGEGPDLIFFTDDDMDIEKMARRGVFADLEPYFESDNFDWSGYNQTVMDAGVWDSHRLVIPLEYNIPMLYTSQTACRIRPDKRGTCSARFLLSMTLPSTRGSPMWITAHKRLTCPSQSSSGAPTFTKI